MNRLWVRLALAMLLVTVISALVVASVARANAARRFETFVNRQRTIAQTDLIDGLVAHYEANGTWNGVEVILGDPREGRRRPPRQGPPGAPPGRFARPNFVLADASGSVVFGSSEMAVGALLSADQREIAVPLVSNGVTAGFLLSFVQGESELVEAQRLFLGEIGGVIWRSALIAGLIAIALSALISRLLTAPLGRLADAARSFSTRNLDVRAVPGGTLEIAEVAHAFNGMADSLRQAEENADIAHELRTPLTVVQGNLRAMVDGVYPLTQDEVAKVYSETRLLGRLIDDLRVLSLAEAGQLDLRVADNPVRALIDDAIEQFAVAAENAGSILNAEVAPDIGVAHYDADRAAQVLRNLVANAIRHTPAGGRVTVSARDRGDGFVRISVSDTGAGIPADDLPHIFERFYRADKSRTRSSGGSGLGLAIVKSLVEAMGGRVGADSAAGVGSTVWFELPRATTPAR
jgi:two-component system, OmpR family, sensor kinase